MAQMVADFVWQRLHEWGVKRVFGYPGDGINGLVGALDRHKEKIDLVQARHEELAAFMACAHSKFTGEVGVCMATSGPGAVHLLNGLYDAEMDHRGVVALVGQQATIGLGGSYQQEIDLQVLFKDVAGAFVQTCSTPEQARHLIDRAMRIAQAEQRVTCIVFPKDIQEMPAVPSPPRKHGATFSGVGYRAPKIVPEDKDLREAADILNQGKKVAILAGAGALGAEEELKEVAELLGAGVAKALLGRALLPDNLPYVTGSIGLLGTKPSDDMMMECDTFFMIGTSFPYAEFLPKEGQAKGVQIDIRARNLSLRYPMDVPPFDYMGYAQSLGLEGVTMKTPDDIVPGWEAALAARRPVVVDAHTDPEVPPLPLHITVKQAMSYAKSIAKGDPEAWDMIKQSAKDMVESYVAPKEK
jgi:pyruvate dehydrogenase (quinone)